MSHRGRRSPRVISNFFSEGEKEARSLSIGSAQRRAPFLRPGKTRPRFHEAHRAPGGLSTALPLWPTYVRLPLCQPRCESIHAEILRGESFRCFFPTCKNSFPAMSCPWHPKSRRSRGLFYNRALAFFFFRLTVWLNRPAKKVRNWRFS